MNNPDIEMIVKSFLDKSGDKELSLKERIEAALLAVSIFQHPEQFGKYNTRTVSPIRATHDHGLVEAHVY